MVSILKQKAYRDATNQVLFVGAIALTVLTFTMVGRENLEAQGITSGFGFLERSTGWSISFSLIEYSTSDPYWKALWVGFLNTSFLGAVSLCLATVLGLIVGIMRVSGNAMAELVGASFVEIFRNVPLLLQVFFWYALLTALPPPRSGIDVLGVVFLSGRGTYLPGLNVTGEVVFLAVVALMAALAGVLWLKSSRRFARRSARDKKRVTRGLLAGWLLLAIVLFWIGNQNHDRAGDRRAPLFLEGIQTEQDQSPSRVNHGPAGAATAMSTQIPVLGRKHGVQDTPVEQVPDDPDQLGTALACAAVR